MATKGDTFTDAGTDVELGAHTPAGPNAGTSWDESIAGGAITIFTGTNKAADGSSVSGNRRRLTDDVGSDEMNVSGDFTSNGTFGQAKWFAVCGRVPNSGTGSGIEGGYDHTLGAAGRYFITDGTTTTESADTAWPGGTVTLELRIRNESLTLYANGASVVSVTGTSLKSGQTRAGLQLGNFFGGTNNMTCDNFEAQSARNIAYLYHQPRGLIFVD